MIESITISFGKPRKPPRQAGDVRVRKGVREVCRQVYVSDRAYGVCGLVAHGRPVLEWVRWAGEDDRSRELNAREGAWEARVAERGLRSES